MYRAFGRVTRKVKGMKVYLTRRVYILTIKRTLRKKKTLAISVTIDA